MCQKVPDVLAASSASFCLQQVRKPSAIRLPRPLGGCGGHLLGSGRHLCSKMRANEAQESSKMNLETFFTRSRGPREPPRHAPGIPKGPRGSPKTLQKPSSDRKLCFVEKFDFPFVKPSFLKVGGSVWEVKIHPERVRRKKKRSQSHH